MLKKKKERNILVFFFCRRNNVTRPTVYMSLFTHRDIRKVNKPPKNHGISSDLRKINRKSRHKIENMDSITATNTISLNCDIELTNKVLNMHAKHFTATDEKQQNIVLLSKR